MIVYCEVAFKSYTSLIIDSIIYGLIVVLNLCHAPFPADSLLEEEKKKVVPKKKPVAVANRRIHSPPGGRWCTVYHCMLGALTKH